MIHCSQIKHRKCESTKLGLSTIHVTLKNARVHVSFCNTCLKDNDQVSAIFICKLCPSSNDQEIPQSQLQTNPWHREEEPHNNHETPRRQTKQNNQLSLFQIKMIAILEWTYSDVQQNREQLLTPTMAETINNKSTTTELQP